MDNIVLDFLKQCNIKLDDANQLEGLMLPRNMLLSDSVYNSIKPAIIDLKKKFSSSSLTSLQKKAGKEQKWPLLNLVRQILKACNYQMKPIRKSAGYTKDGKKKYCRYFFITKFKKIIKNMDLSNNMVDISINMITNQ
jgi:hypothetical protein